LSSTYPNAIGARALKTRIDFLFPKLDFSLSDQQIPMFIRLFNLALALYLGDFKNKPDKKEEADDNTSTVVDDTNVEEENSENQSWAGWAWGYVPAILPVWENDAAESGEVLPSDRERIFQFGVFIERVNWTFKWAELIRDVSISSAPSRLRFQPFLTARMQGCFLQVTVAGVEWVDVQGGVSHLMLEPSSSYCLCGVQEDTTLYYLQGCERSAFLNESLYDPIEKVEQTVESKPNFQWEDHVQRITEATLLERTPALGFDYLYQLELPGDITSEYLSQLGSEFEYSNLPEKALFRLAVSPLQLKVSYGLVHRLSALLHAAHNYNYPDYADPELEIIRRSSIPPDTDQLLNLGSNLPSRTYQVAVLRPLVFISVTPPHPTFDLQRLVERRVIRMRDNVNCTPTVSLPVLKFACTCADLQVVRPMYPIRLTMALQSLPSPPASLVQQGHTMVQLKFQELSTELVMEEFHLPLLKPCNASASLKLLLLPELWQTERVIFSCKLESEKLELLASRPQIDFVTSVWKTLTDPVTLTTPNRIVLFEVLNQAAHPTLQLNLNGFRMDYIRTASMVCAGSSIRSLNASIVQTNAVPFFSHTSDPHRNNFTEWLIQFPHSLIQRKVEAHSAAPVFVFKMSSFDVLLDAGWLKWLNYRSDALVENATSIGPEEETETLQPTSFRSNQSNCARDSGLSSSMDGQTWRASSFQQSTLTKSAEETSSTYEPVDWIAIRRLLQRSILHIDIQPSSLVLSGDSGELRLQFQLPAVYVSCPHIRTSSLTLEDLPFRESGSLVSSFPWTVSFQHFGFSSGLHFDSLRPILEPISLKMTIALNPSTANSPVDPVKCTDIRPPSIDLCIHIDMNAIEISLDVQQLQLLCDKFADLSNWLGVSTSNSPTITTSRSNFEIGLWLQWAMPRFVLALETPSSRTVLDMEDVTTSVDYQHRQYAKIKSRLTSVSVKLFTKTQETWILESKTNGIVMSCVDDITRDLLPSGAVGKTVAVPSISTAPSDAFQPQPASKNSVGGNAGGILTLTWTRAQRQDVHSKWHSRGRRKSNQTEEEVEEVVSPSDRYLHEVDIALEAIDVVLTEILLDHLIQLAQPALNSLSRILTPTCTLPASSHTLPLIFATSKGLRVFLVQEKFLLLNLDGAELSPHVQNPVGRSVQLKPDLYDEAERQGLLFIPGHDVEDRQYQIDLSGLSFSSGYLPKIIFKGMYYINNKLFAGCWREVERASWVWRTLNPASTLHTMAENPALEWNARQEQPSEPSVGLTPILARCSLRVIYAPPIVSLEQQCLVAGQAIEVNASSDIQLLIDAKQIDYYIQWMNILLSAATNLSSKEQQVAGFPAHSFFTSNRVCVIIYTSQPDEFLPFALINLIQPHVLIKTADQEVHEIAVYDIRLQLPCWADGSPVKSCLLPDESMYPISLIETRLGQPSIITGVPPSLFRLEIISARQLNVELGRPFKFILHADNISNLQYLARQLEAFQTKQEDSKPSLYRQICLKTSQMVVEIPVPSAVIIAGLNDMLLDVTCQLDTNEEKREKLEANLILNAFSVKAEMDQNINLQLCDPFSLDSRIQLLWPHWLSNKRVLVRAFCRADNLRLHAGPRQVTVATALTQWMLQNYSPSQNDDPAPKDVVVDTDEQHYQDDLRTGTFDFQVRDTTSRPSSGWMQAEEKPRPYQVVFNVQPASMCWAYPQPRALTRVDVYPIPLMKADGAGQDAAPGVEQVDCTLEFWDHCSQEFRILRRFSLSEVRFTRVPLPSISTNQTARNVQDDERRAERELLEKQVAFSDMWRIVMHFTEENLPENRPKKIIAAPPSNISSYHID
jgi:vacuolar protein sorting-associated protein 13B